jgi:hypothetical protein
MKKRATTLLLFLTLALAFGPGLINTVKAADASLLLSPESGSYNVGSTFSIKVIVDSGGGTGINAADGIITFDASYLSVTGLGKTNSIFTLWTQEPTFSNSKGEISFGGGNPQAFKGTFGTIFTITFKALKEGDTKVKFSSGSVLAADGMGTNVLSSYGEGNYTLKKASTTPPPEEEEETTPAGTGGLLPPLPKVSSPTHPEPESWYSNNNPEFEWELPPDVVGVSLLLHERPDAVPDSNSEGLLESATYDDAVEDGIWYFHIKFKNNHGWGPVAHRKVLIDTVPPEPFTVRVEMTDPTDPQPVLVFSTTTDSLSGIDHYEMKVGEEDWSQMDPNNFQDRRYKMPTQSPGDIQVEVRAVDKAGNSTASSVNIAIEPLKAPTITDVPEQIDLGDILIVKGISFYPQAKIEVFMEKEEGGGSLTGQTMTASDGTWTFFAQDGLEEGSYGVWARIIDSRGAQSDPSSRSSFGVIPPSLIELYGQFIILGLALIVVVLIVIIFLQRAKCADRISKIKKETEEVKFTSGKVFNALRQEVEEQVEFLDNKPSLSESEEYVRDKLKEALDISEEFLGKEIKDIEEELGMEKGK